MRPAVPPNGVVRTVVRRFRGPCPPVNQTAEVFAAGAGQVDCGNAHPVRITGSHELRRLIEVNFRHSAPLLLRWLTGTPRLFICRQSGGRCPARDSVSNPASTACSPPRTSRSRPTQTASVAFPSLHSNRENQGERAFRRIASDVNRRCPASRSRASRASEAMP